MEQTLRQKIKKKIAYRILFSLFLSIFPIILLYSWNVNSLLQEQELLFNFALKLGVLILFLFLGIWTLWPLYYRIPDIILEPIDELLLAIGEKTDNNLLYQNIESDIKEINMLKKKMMALFSQLQNTPKETAILNIAKQVAHDLRSPVLALETICSMSPELPAEKRDLIKKTTKRITAIVNNLFNITNPDESLEVDKIANKKFIIDVIMDVIEEKKIECYERDIVFKVHSSDKIMGLIADISDEKIERCLSNVLNNSIEAMGNYGELSIYLNPVDNQINIKIVDSGKGIPQDMLDKIFIKGFSFDKKEGHGLGLSYAKECLEQAGGFIRVEAGINKGTTVDIFIKSKSY